MKKTISKVVLGLAVAATMCVSVKASSYALYYSDAKKPVHVYDEGGHNYKISTYMDCIGSSMINYSQQGFKGYYTYDSKHK